MSPQQWFDEYVNVERLTKSVISSMTESINNDNIEDDTYIALVNDIISSGNGQYIPFLALEYFGYELNTDNIEQYDLESALWELDNFTGELADIIKEALGLGIDIQFGHWDADGTYCMMALMDKYTFEENREESYSFIEVFDEGQDNSLYL